MVDTAAKLSDFGAVARRIDPYQRTLEIVSTNSQGLQSQTAYRLAGSGQYLAVWTERHCPQRTAVRGYDANVSRFELDQLHLPRRSSGKRQQFPA